MDSYISIIRSAKFLNISVPDMKRYIKQGSSAFGKINGDLEIGILESDLIEFKRKKNNRMLETLNELTELAEDGELYN